MLQLARRTPRVILTRAMDRYERLHSRAAHTVKRLEGKVRQLRGVVAAAGKAINAMGSASSTSLAILVDEIQQSPDARVLQTVLNSRDKRPDEFMPKVGFVAIVLAGISHTAFTESRV